MRGFSYPTLGKVDLAFVHYFRTLEIEPQHLGAHDYLGDLYLMENKPQRALSHSKGIEKSPACDSGCEALEELKAAIENYKVTHGDQ